MREIMEVQNEDDIALDNAMDDADAQEIQSEIMERMAAFGIEMEDMEEIQEALDIPIMEDDIAMDVSEEEQLMQEMAASEISEEQVDIEMEAEVSADTSDDAAIEDDLDLEEVEIDEQEFDI